MSKSTGNYIGISESPKEIYGKTMSIPDALIVRYFELAACAPPDEVESIRKELADTSVNPRDLKRRLARALVALYHGDEASGTAEAEFDRIFAKGGLPDEIPEPTFTVGGQTDRGAVWVVALLTGAGLASSNGEARRLIQQGGLRVDGETVRDVDFSVSIDSPILLQAGKRRFVRVLPENVSLGEDGGS